jgi:hypothetical protein
MHRLLPLTQRYPHKAAHHRERIRTGLDPGVWIDRLIALVTDLPPPQVIFSSRRTMRILICFDLMVLKVEVPTMVRSSVLRRKICY